MKFIVDRKTWYRGRGGAYSRLLTNDGKRCCIGFVCKQAGIPDSSIKNERSIASCEMEPKKRKAIEKSKLPHWLGEHSQVIYCYHINDNHSLTDGLREKLLKERFAMHGDEIEFVG